MSTAVEDRLIEAAWDKEMENGRVGIGPEHKRLFRAGWLASHALTTQAPAEPAELPEPFAELHEPETEFEDGTWHRPLGQGWSGGTLVYSADQMRAALAAPTPVEVPIWTQEQVAEVGVLADQMLAKMKPSPEAAAPVEPASDLLKRAADMLDDPQGWYDEHTGRARRMTIEEHRNIIAMRIELNQMRRELIAELRAAAPAVPLGDPK